jgi:hypothetical protein
MHESPSLMRAPSRRPVPTTQGFPMNATITSPSTQYQLPPSPGNEALQNYRERRAYEELERAERRRVNLAALYTDVSSADLRIRAWERAHQLRMPADPLHPALDAIAAATRLTLAEVREEQRLRFPQQVPAAI